MTETVLIAAGGTGGHLFPAAAFAEEMARRGWLIVLMTDARGRRYAENFPADVIEETPAATFGANPLKAAPAALKIAQGVMKAQQRTRAIDPAVVAGFGGYPSLPALTAAWSQGRPILIHEQNAVLGRVNRAFSGRAAAIASGFERLDRLPPSAAGRRVVTGNPVRPQILEARDAPYPDIPAGGTLGVMVIGGSQGARIFGEVVPAAIERLPQALRARLNLTQQVREEQVAEIGSLYARMGVKAEIAPFFKDMGARLKKAHLVIARAGASSVTELQAAGRPSILVPLAIAADDHQTANAEALSGVGAADVIPEPAFDPERLGALLETRLTDTHGLAVRAAAARASARIDAAARLADLAEGLARGQAPLGQDRA